MRVPKARSYAQPPELHPSQSRQAKQRATPKAKSDDLSYCEAPSYLIHQLYHLFFVFEPFVLFKIPLFNRKMSSASLWMRFRQTLGRSLREMGQALDRVGVRGQQIAHGRKRLVGDDPHIFDDFLSTTSTSNAHCWNEALLELTTILPIWHPVRH